MRLRERLVGAPNALTARVVEEAGFEAVYLSGAGIANTFLGAPDIGLFGLAELRDHVAAVRDAVDLPWWSTRGAADGAGAGPGRCGRAAAGGPGGTEAVRALRGQGRDLHRGDGGKIHAALDAAGTGGPLFIARTDARAVEGLDAACERALRYREAGADAVFVEAPRTRAEMAEIPRRVPGPHVVNMVEGGLPPVLPLAELGFAIALYANTAMRAAVAGMTPVLRHLREHGDTRGLDEKIISWAERQALVRKPAYDLRLHGGLVCLPGSGLSSVDVAARDGRIAALLDPADPAPATRTLDVTGRWVLPGAVDAHVRARRRAWTSTTPATGAPRRCGGRASSTRCTAG